MNSERLEAQAVAALLEKGLTISTAESCTGGWVGKRLTDISGSSAAFQGGVISYTNAVKHQVLQVPEQMLKQCGAVSEEVARAMAEGVRALLKTDLGISTTGVAGPSSDEMGNPIGLVYIALATPKETCCRRLRLTGDREQIRRQAVTSALQFVLSYLEEEV